MNKLGSFVALFNNDMSKIFLVRRSDFPVWEIQGGGVENDEDVESTAIREAFEETGFKIQILRKVAEYYKNGNIKTHLFQGKIISGKYKPEYKGCQGVWFEVSSLPKNMTNKIRVMIMDCLSKNKKVVKKKEPGIYNLQNLHLLFLHPIEVFKFIFGIN